MSTTVDQYTVQMKFDNSDFERKVSDTISTLDKFKSSLASLGHDSAATAMNTIGKHMDSMVKGFADAKKGIDEVGEATKNITGNFNAMDIAFATTIANMTMKAEKFAADLAKALTIEPIKLGFQEYETQIKATQVIKANTGKDIKEINDVLDEMNTYADKTIYNFTQMTDNLGKFTAQGVDLYKAKDAIMGMANAAAMFGATPQDLSRATYQMSQALGGVIRMQDWNSLRNANMATAKLKQTIIDTAVEMGVLESSTPDWGAMVKGATTFEKSLESGWLTGEIFVEAMRKFNDTTTALGIEAQEAATHAKTFTQLRDATMEAVQSGWTRVFRTIIGDLDQAEEFWSKVNNALNGEHGIITAYSDAIGGAFEEWAANGGREKAIEGLSDAFHGLLNVVVPVKDALAEIFPNLDGDRLLEFTDKVAESASKFHDFGTKFRSYFGDFVEKYDKQVKKWSETITTTEQVSASDDDVEKALMNSVLNNPYYQRLVDAYLSRFNSDEFKDKDGNLVESKIKAYLKKEGFQIFDRFVGNSSSGAPYRNSNSIIDLLTYRTGANTDTINNYYKNGVKSVSHFDHNQYRDDLYHLYRAVLAQNGIDVDEQLGVMQESLKTYQQVSKEIWHVEEETKALIVPASDVNERVKGTELAAKNLYTIVKGFPIVVNGIKDAVGGFYNKLIKPIAGNILGNALQTGLQLTARLVTDLTTITNLIRKFGIVDKVIDGLYNFFNRNFDIAGWFQTFYNTFINFRSTIKDVITDVGTFFGFFDDSKLVKRIQAVGTVIFHTIRDLLGNNIMTGGLMGSVTGMLSGAFTGFFKGDKGKFGGLGGLIKGALKGALGGAFNGLKFGGLLEILNRISKGSIDTSGVIGFIQSLGDKIGGLIEKVKNFNFDEFITKVKGFSDTFFEIITELGLGENGKFSFTTFVMNFFKLGVAGIEAFINGLLGKKNEAQEQTKSLFNYIVEFGTTIFDSFKNSGFGQYLIGVFNNVKAVVTGLFTIIDGLINVGLILLTDVVIPIATSLADVLSHTLPDGQTVAQKLGEAFTWIGGTALPTVIGGFTKVADIVADVVSTVQTLYTKAKEIFELYRKNNPDSFITRTYNAFIWVVGKIKDGLSTIGSEGAEGISSLWEKFKITEVGKTLIAFVDIIKGFAGAIKQGFLGIEESAEGTGEGLFSISKLDTTGIINFFKSLAKGIQEFPTSETFAKIKDGLVTFGSGLRDAFNGLKTIFTEVIVPVFTFLKEKAPTVIDTLVHGFQNITGLLSEAANGNVSFEQFVKNLIGDPMGAVKKAFGGIGSGIGFVLGKLGEAFTGTTTYAADFDDSLYDKTTNDFQVFRKYANMYREVAEAAGVAEAQINSFIETYSEPDIEFDSEGFTTKIYSIGQVQKEIDRLTENLAGSTEEAAADIEKSGNELATATQTATNQLTKSVTTVTAVKYNNGEAFAKFAGKLKEGFERVMTELRPWIDEFKGTLAKIAENESWRKLALGAFGIFALKQVTNTATRGWNKAFKKVSEQIGKDGKEAATTLGGSLKNSAEALKSGMKGIFEPFGEIGKAIGKTFDMITAAFTNLDKLSKSIARANTAEAFKDYSFGILMLAAAFSAVALVLDHIGLDNWKVLATAGGILTAFLVAGIGIMELVEHFSETIRNATAPLKGAEGVPVVINNFLSVVGDSIKGFLKKLGTKEVLIGIAIAMGTLTASLVALSFVPGQNLLKAGVALAGLAVGLRALMNAAGGNRLGTGLGILLIATSIAQLIMTMKTISRLDPGALVASVLTIGALMAEIWAFLKATKGNGTDIQTSMKQILSSAAAMMAIGIGIKSMASAVKTLGKLDIGTLIKGLISVAAVLAEMSVFVRYTKNTEMYTKTATAMTVMSTALNIMSVAVRNFGSIDFPTLVKGLVSVGVLMAGISKFMQSVDWKIIPIRTSISMVALAAAINMLDDAVKNLGDIDFWSLLKGIGSVSALMVGISDAVSTMQGDAVKIRSMLASAVLVVEMYATLSLIKQYGEIDLGPLAKGVASFIAVLWSLSGATKLLGDYKGGIIKPFLMLAFTLTGVVAALTFLTSSELDADRFLKFASGISMCVVSMGAIAALLGTLKVGFTEGALAGSAIVGFMGTIVGLTGVLATVAMAIGNIVNTGAEFFGIKGSDGEAFDIFEEIGNIIERFVGFVGRLGGVLAGSALDGFTEAVGNGEGLDSFGAALETFGGHIESFKESLKSLKDLSSEEIGQGITNFCEAVGTITSAELKDAISDLLHNWVTGSDEANALSDFGTDLAGFGDGAAKFSTFIMSVNNGIKSKAEKIAEVLEILTGVVPKSGSILEVISGSQDFSDFGGKFADFGNKIKEFATNVGEIQNISSINAINPVMSSVATLMGQTFAFDVAQFGSMSELLPGLGSSLGTFATNINEIDDSKGTASVKLVEQIIALQGALTGYDVEALSNVQSFLDTFDGFSSSFTTFMSNLSGAISNVQEISVVNNKGEIEKKFADATEILNIAISPVNAIQKLIQQFKKIGKQKTTLTEWFTGDTTISHLGSQLSSFGTNYSTFLTSVAELNKTLTGSDYNTTLDAVLEHVTKIITSLQDFDKLPAQTGFIERIFGKEDKTLSTFGSNLSSFGNSLKKFVQALMTSDNETKSMNELLSEEGSKENLTALIEKASEIIQAFNGIEIPDQGSFLSKIITADTSLQSFGTGLSAFGSGLKDFVTNAAGINDTEVVDNAITAIGKIFTLFKESGVTSDTMWDFGEGLTFLGNFNDKLATMLQINEGATGDEGALKPIYDIFAEAGGKAIEKFSEGMSGENRYTLTNAVQTVVDLANADIMDYVDKNLNEVGEYYVLGFAKGIQNTLEESNAASTELGAAALEALKEVLEMHSPPDTTIEPGEFFSIGFGIGERNKIPFAEEAARELGSSSVSALKDSVKDVEEVGKETAKGFTDSLSEGIDATVGGIKDSGVFDTAKETVTNGFNEVKDKVTGVADDIANAVSSAVSPLTDKISEAFDGIKGIFSPNGDFFTNLTSAWGNPEEMINKMANDMVNSVGGLQDNIFGGDSIFAGINSTSDEFLKSMNDLGDKLGNQLGLNGSEEIADGVASGIEEAGSKVYDSIDNMAWRVISGEFGNGDERVAALRSLGLSYEVIQNRVNELLGCNFRYATSNEDLTNTLVALGDAAANTGEVAEEVGDATEDLIQRFKEINDENGSLVDESKIKDIVANGKLTAAGFSELVSFMGDYSDEYKKLAEKIYGESYEELAEKGAIDSSEKFFNTFLAEWTKHNDDPNYKISLGDLVTNALKVTKGNEEIDKYIDESFAKPAEKALERVNEKLYEAAKRAADATGESVAKAPSGPAEYFDYIQECAKSAKELLQKGDVDEAFDMIEEGQKALDDVAGRHNIDLEPDIVKAGRKVLSDLDGIKDSYEALKELQDTIVIGEDNTMYVRDKTNEFIRNLRLSVAEMTNQIDSSLIDGAFKENVNRVLKLLDDKNIDGAMSVLGTLYKTLEGKVEAESDKVKDASDYIEKAITSMAKGDFDKAGQYISTASNALVESTNRARDEYYAAVEYFDEGTSRGIEELSHLREQINTALSDGDLSLALTLAKRYNDALNAELERNEVDTRSRVEIFADTYKEWFKAGATELAGCVSESNQENLGLAMEELKQYTEEFTRLFGDEYKDAADYMKKAFEAVEKNNDWGKASEYLNSASENMAEISKNASEEYRSASDELAAAYEARDAGDTDEMQARLDAALADIDAKTVLLEEFTSNHATSMQTVEENAGTAADTVANTSSEIEKDVEETATKVTDSVNKASSEVKDSTEGTINEVLSDLDDAVTDFTTSGENLASGLGNGYVNKMRSEVIPNAQAANQELVDATRATFDEQSPSRVAYGIGAYFGEGMYNGVSSWHDRIQNTMLDTADGMITGATHALQMARLAINDDVNIKPSIAPVLDMSNIDKNGAAYRMFTGRPTFDFKDFNVRGIDKVRNIAEAMSGFTSDNSDVVNAIHEMRGDITTLGESMENMSIVMDSGRLVGQITNDMSRSLGRASKLRERRVR